ncbi:hypothetical protein [Arcobacter porcinus]|uniref:hypothetical protein n=1 Tax=Arcobacter porcinus TaxID=1935204 RepID=UPI0008242DD4|nr:hypothetical protein [Arcobacter porcinus]OCL85613.1 hypothetical protein AAX30_01811 [Arcobacter porcinus]
MFNILIKNKLKLKGKLLIVMKDSFIYQENLISKKVSKKILYLKKILFFLHDSSFSTKEWKSFKKEFEEILKND